MVVLVLVAEEMDEGVYPYPSVSDQLATDTADILIAEIQDVGGKEGA